MKLIIGLGNPGKKYERTRHNLGWSVVDALQSKSKFKFKNVVVKKTNVFMNKSGIAVKKLIENCNPPAGGENLYVIHDDLDIPLGQFKIQFGKGPKNHNGVRSVEESLGTKNFWRVRVGIENRDKGAARGEPRQRREGGRVKGEEYVLEEFTEEEQRVIDGVVEEIVNKLRA